MPHSGCLNTDSYDPELTEGARNAVHTCLSIDSTDRVVLIADHSSLEIASSIYTEIIRTKAKVSCFIIEEYAERPIDVMNPAVLRALSDATVSLMTIQLFPGELHARKQVMEIVHENKIRHAHMPGIEHQMMVTGMRADYHKVARLQRRLLKHMKPDSLIHVRSEGGTDIEIKLTPDHRWVNSNGLIRAGLFQNLPTGQLLTTPKSADGVFVCDGAIGEWFGAKYPDVASYPLVVEVSEGRVLDAKSSKESLARQFLLYVRSNVGGDRVGEFSIGTNLALNKFLGKALQDENVPGSHIAFGGSGVLSATGAKWSAKTQVALITRDCDILIDGVAVMNKGVFIPEILTDL